MDGSAHTKGDKAKMQMIAVDDENAALSVLMDAIAEATTEQYSDVHIEGFRSTGEALLYAKEHAVDVAFLDIEMREMTGLELAKKLKGISPKINIVFVTGYSEYMKQAISLHASGYLTKPVRAEDVAEELDNLLHPIEVTEEITIRTFGNFEVLCNGKPVEFERSKAKELLAYLVSRGGATVTRKEIAAILFENQESDIKTQDYISKIYRSLRMTLKSIHAEDILIKGRNLYGVDLSKVSCDAMDYLNGLPYAINLFQGEYMSQYSWAEGMIGRFMDLPDKD